MLEGSCHCGAIKIRVTRKPRQLTRCNCSICRRYAALWLYGTEKTIRVRGHGKGAVPYLWKGRRIAFFHCCHCGCLTHYRSTRAAGATRIAVNARMLAPDDITGIRIRTFDGASTWRYLD